MALTLDEVRRIALLARLELSESEESDLQKQLGHILEHFERLGALNTDGVQPTAYVPGVDTAYRDDVVSNPPADEALRANAPSRDATLFKVPKIIE